MSLLITWHILINTKYKTNVEVCSASDLLIPRIGGLDRAVGGTFENASFRNSTAAEISELPLYTISTVRDADT